MLTELPITNITAREILDSRGTPTVEAEVSTPLGKGCASVPSGASTGVFEAAALHDGDRRRYSGKGVQNAVANVNQKIRPKLIGFNALEQRKIDKLMCELDGTPNKEILGANATLAVSLAAAKAAANSLKLPLYRYIGGANAHILPMPMMNIINGGAHADNNIDIQEFMIMPFGASCFSAGLRMCSEIYHTLKNILRKNGYSTAVGDEGGFAPNIESDTAVLDIITAAVEDCGYTVGGDFKLALDAASSEWYSANNMYRLPKSGKTKTSEELASYWQKLCRKYPIYSIEDGCAEDDWNGWSHLTQKLGSEIKLVGDDLFVTNIERLSRGINSNIANAILIKPNQIGTLTETLDTVHTAQANGYTAILSHRSGETEDTSIADIAVAVNCGFIKSGAPCRGERICKYNRLLKIEEELGRNGKFINQQQPAKLF